jgi:L,D-peptidoglycan transpeptidase YkuD (ErfK/YbiS/YcfS/YnhG family)
VRRVFYRSDKGPPPETGLPVIGLKPEDGWSDDPAEPSYNRLVPLPCQGSHERLWRADGLYDLVVELGYNDDPVVAGAGSAIFLHVARAGYAPTEGCIALAEPDLRAVLRLLGGGSVIEIRA